MIHNLEEMLAGADAEIQKLYAAQLGPTMLGVTQADQLMEALATLKQLGQWLVAEADERLLIVAQFRAKYFALAEIQGAQNPISIN